MQKSIFHAKLESLDRRLIHPNQEIKQELARCSAGLKGEATIYNMLKQAPTPFHLLHDIRLPLPNRFGHFQIDILVLTRFAAFILEAKYIQGHLIFNRNTRQLIRGKQVFDDPFTQVFRHKTGLEQWLDHLLPVIPFVVMTHPNAQIDFIPPDSADRQTLLFTSEITSKLDECLASKKSLLTEQELATLAIKLKAAERPLNINILQHFHIRNEQLQQGILCEGCDHWTVQKKGKRWRCTRCKAVSVDGALLALKDYTRLFGRDITNQQIRAFAGIHSETIAKKLLQKWAVSHTGEFKIRTYQMPEQWMRE
ncbi:nuclease-related domain-containing protein [Domibacillus enclensis]|uniref:Nuclease-related domain-containing protein n=1 Tax=Domibacillus enclensis TaxID=1017273 RepID=A0A1N6RJX8_9BACI|nr:nuclease-related domain-containing protein [Domibacillus enclensis]OXS79079.1 hypothetical protein B1B05_04690 [Domibacillus enclensis]SIQ29131.1 Nuclease-related domain-containing protein [Domibacillus enclensis]